MGLAGDLIIIIVFGLAAGLIFNLVKLPPIIGYIVAGIIIGPFTGGVTVSDIPRIELLAEIGVALLLFSIGLDLSFKELKDVKGIAITGTLLQITLCVLAGFGIGYLMGLPANVSIVFGMIISLSSTMVVLKVLMSRGLIGTLSSRVMIGMLIVQDLAAIPMMIVIPQLQNITGNLPAIGFTILKAFIVLFIIIMIGMRLIPFLLRYVAKLNSRELFLITITAIGLGVGYITHLAGLSLAFGAFVAGMVISESDYSHQALNDIIPLRDIFGLIFFSSIGMLIDPSFVSANLSKILLIVLFVTLCKFSVFSSISVVFKYRNIIPLALGLSLAQIGEFSFVLARTGVQNSIIDKDFYSLILSVSVITMILSPFLSMLSAPLYSMKTKWFRHEPFVTINIPEEGLNSHLIIAGGGRIGSQIASVISRLKIPFIIIEQDYRRFENLKKSGYPAIYGDAGLETVLDAANIKKSRLIIITAPSLLTVRELLSSSSHLNAETDIIVRADDINQMSELRKLNLTEIIQPEFEAGLEMVRQTLLHLDYGVPEIHNLIDNIKREAYPFKGRNYQNISVLSTMKDTPFLIETGWYEIKPGGKFDGNSLKSLEVRKKTGISVVGLIRGSEFIPNPEPEVIFTAGDLIATIGLKEKRILFEKTFFT